jgi:hypothetical protein
VVSGQEPLGDDLYYERYAGTDNKTIAEIIRLSKNGEKDALKKSYILKFVQTENGEPDGIIKDTPRNNLARLEHLRWNTFHLVHGWTKLPISKIKAGNGGRQNRFTKQHACITTFEDLIQLRKIQAEKAVAENPGLSLKEAESKADTIWYDFNLMDELPVRLLASNKTISKWRTQA